MYQEPAGKAGDDGYDDGTAVFGADLEGLAGHDDAYPKKDAEQCFYGDDFEDEGDAADQKDTGDDNAVEDGVSVAGTHLFPAGVSDVDGGGIGTAEKGGDEAAQSVDQQAGACLEMVSAGFGTDKVFQRAENAEDCHGDDDGHVFPAVAINEKRKEVPDNGDGIIKGEVVRSLGWLQNKGQKCKYLIVEKYMILWAKDLFLLRFLVL